MSRFKLSEAKRGALPLFIGLCGPSGGGKTFSALRLATGIQRVAGGKLAVIDTEANRALHYAEDFKFQHMPFEAPFSPDDYAEAIRDCVSAGARTVVIDSMSHEHEGPGGVLEWHESEMQRLAKAWNQSEAAVTFPAWAEPKAARRRLVNAILQLHVNLICCFRAKRKVEMPKKGSGDRNPKDMGWMPIAGSEYAYEMTALGVLPPGAKGVPDWSPLDPGSEMVTKRPAQFEHILKPGEQLSEAMGEAMARWALGSDSKPAGKPQRSPAARALLQGMADAANMTALTDVADKLAEDQSLSAEETQFLTEQLKRRKAQLEGTAGK
jgi:hypothetical protein